MLPTAFSRLPPCDDAPQTVVVTDVNEPPIIFPGNFTVKDYAPPDTFVGTIRYFDPDIKVNGSRTERYVEFSILEGDPTGAFAIGSTAGVCLSLCVQCLSLPC